MTSPLGSCSRCGLRRAIKPGRVLCNACIRRDDTQPPDFTDAACRTMSPGLFDTQPLGGNPEAMAACAVCPILADCRDYALASPANRLGLVLAGVAYDDLGKPKAARRRPGPKVARECYADDCTATIPADAYESRRFCSRACATRTRYHEKKRWKGAAA